MVRRWMTGLRFAHLSPRVEDRTEEPVQMTLESSPRSDTDAVVIRRAVPRDVRVLAGLWREMMEFHRKLDPAFEFGPAAQTGIEKHLSETIRSTGGRVFVASAGGRMIGYILGEIQERKPIYPLGRYGFISDLSVTSAWRRRGVGRALVNTLMAWFHEHGVTAIELFILENNDVSTAFWQSVGFRHYLRLLRHDVMQVGEANNAVNSEGAA